MENKMQRRYLKFLGDDELLKEFLPSISTEESDSDTVESYIFPSSPRYVKAQMRDYQVEGLNWLVNMHENSVNCILADEMGLGKTLQSISLLGYLKFIKNEYKKSLIVVPKSVLQNWANEFQKFIPDMRIKIFWCSKKEIRAEAKEVMHKKYDVIITTYEMCLYAQKYLKRVKFEYLIVDEGHRLKNEDSQLSRILRLFNFRHRLLLTGTPLQNNIHELWALLNFILPDVFYDSEKFEEFIKKAGQDPDNGKINKIRRLLSSFFLRREKADVEKSLLPKKITNLYCPLSEMQRDWYKGILKRDLSELYTDVKIPKMSLLNLIMQLKKCCNHPYLFEGAEQDPDNTGEDLVDVSGKLLFLDKLLSSLQKKGSRVLIFSQMARMLDILEDYVNLRGFSYCRIDGSTMGSDRTDQIEEFNRENSEKFIFLLTTRAGGLGINLYTADSVIIYDSDWNPYADIQAQDRAHRIGQKKQVQVFRLVTENTIEESIILKAQQKLKLDDVLMRKEEKKKQSSLTNQELMQILASGLDAIENAPANQQGLSFEEILKIGQEKTKIMQEQIDNFKIGNEEPSKINYMNWEGQNYCRQKIDKFVEQHYEPPADMVTKRLSNFMTSTFKPKFFPEYQFYPQEFYDLQEKEAELHRLGRALSEEEKEQKDKLLEMGFGWTRNDYKAFVNALDVVGQNKQAVCEILKDKPDANRYYDVFFERLDELSDAERIKTILKKSEMKKVHNQRFKSIIESYSDLELDKAISPKNKFYLDNLDLLKEYKNFIEGEFSIEQLKAHIMLNEKYSCDYFLRSKSTSDLSKYINGLINQLIKKFDKKEEAEEIVVE